MVRRTISFWIWGAFTPGKDNIYHQPEILFQQLKERGYNCIRLDDGAGYAHTADGMPRGRLDYLAPFGEFARYTRQNEQSVNGSCDVLKNLIRLGKLAQKYQVKLILSSWYYLHTFWFASQEIGDELEAIPPEERYDYFARALDYIIREFKKENIADVIEFVEIFNEADGLPFIADYGMIPVSDADAELWRKRHEKAIDFLKKAHPEIPVAYDTYTPFTDERFFPRNADIWNFHSYYLWNVYDIFDHRLVGGNTNPDAPEWNVLEPYLSPDKPSFEEVVNSRKGRVPAVIGWYRRIWIYNHLDPVKIPEIDQMLRKNLAENMDFFRNRVDEAVDKVLEIRFRIAPEIKLCMGEGATYCGNSLLRWEENSPEYWEILEYATEKLRDAGVFGTVIRTNSGPDDPSWLETPDKIRKANEIFRKGSL